MTNLAAGDTSVGSTPTTSRRRMFAATPHAYCAPRSRPPRRRGGALRGGSSGRRGAPSIRQRRPRMTPPTCSDRKRSSSSPERRTHRASRASLGSRSRRVVRAARYRTRSGLGSCARRKRGDSTDRPSVARTPRDVLHAARGGARDTDRADRGVVAAGAATATEHPGSMRTRRGPSPSTPTPHPHSPGGGDLLGPVAWFLSAVNRCMRR